jgi:hypothetical protein
MTTRVRNLDYLYRYCDGGTDARRTMPGMGSPFDDNDPRHQTLQPTPEEVERVRQIIEEEFGPDVDEGNPFGEAPEPDYPEPDPEKCPECGKALDWEDPDEPGDTGCWYCETCQGSLLDDGTLEHW